MDDQDRQEMDKRAPTTYLLQQLEILKPEQKLALAKFFEQTGIEGVDQLVDTLEDISRHHDSMNPYVTRDSSGRRMNTRYLKDKQRGGKKKTRRKMRYSKKRISTKRKSKKRTSRKKVSRKRTRRTNRNRRNLIGGGDASSVGEITNPLEKKTTPSDLPFADRPELKPSPFSRTDPLYEVLPPLSPEATEQEKRLYIETLANNAKEIYGKDILMYAEKDERGNIKVPMVVVGEAEEGEVSEQEINLKIEHLSSKKGRNIPPLLKSPFDFSEHGAIYTNII